MSSIFFRIYLKLGVRISKIVERQNSPSPSSGCAGYLTHPNILLVI